MFSKQMKRHMSSRSCGSWVVAGTLLALIMVAALHLLRTDYNPLRNFTSEYLLGPFGILAAAAAFILAATFLILLVGLRLTVRPSVFLTASCVLLGVMVVSVCVCAVFPFDPLPPDDSHPTFISSGAIIHVVSSALLYVSLVTLSLGFLNLASFAALVFAPFYLRGLAQRGGWLAVLVWLLLTGLRLRQAIPESFIRAALLFVMAITFIIFLAAGVFRISSSFFTPPRTPYLYWGLVVLCIAMGTFSFWRGIVELFSYLRERKMESSLR